MHGAREALFTIILAVAMATASPVRADEAGEAAVRAFVASADASLHWDATSGTIASDGGETLVNALAIAQTDTGFRLSARSIRLSGFKPGADGGFAASSVAVEGGFAGWPQLNISAPRLTAEVFSTPGFEGWRFEPSRPAASLAEFLTTLAATQFESAEMPSAEIAYTVGSPGGAGSSIATATLANLSFGSMKAGVLQDVSLGKVEAAWVQGPLPPLTARFEGMSASGLDPGGFGRLLDPGAYASGKGDGVWRVLVQSVHYGALRLSIGSKNALSFAGLDITKVEGRQPDASPAQLFDRLIAENPEGAPEKTFEFLLAHGRSLSGWLKLGELTLGPASFKPEEGIEVSVKEFGIRALSPDGLKSAWLKGFVFDPPGGEGLKIGGAAIGGVEWPDQTALISTILGFERASRFADLTADAKDSFYGGLLQIWPHVGTAELENAEFPWSEGQPIKLASFSLKAEGPYLGPLPKAAEMSVAGLLLPAAFFNQMMPEDQMAQLGYDGLTIDASATGAYNAAAGQLERHLSITVKDAGVIDFGATLTGVNEASLRQLARVLAGPVLGLMPDGGVTKLPGFAVSSAKLRYDDMSLAGRLAGAEAKRLGLDSAAVIANTQNEIASSLAGLGLTERGESIAATLGGFLAQPKSLTLTLEPDVPVPLALLAAIREDAYGVALDILAAKFTAND